MSSHNDSFAASGSSPTPDSATSDFSKSYAAERRKLIHLDSTIPVATAGDVDAQGDKHTTHLSVVDGDDNMVALTQTLGDLFGSGVITADTGVLFSDEMRHLHLDPNDPSRLEPGKRSRSNQSPLIVLKDGKPFMTIGTPGSNGIWQRIVQVIVNVAKPSTLSLVTSEKELCNKPRNFDEAVLIFMSHAFWNSAQAFGPIAFRITGWRLLDRA